MLKLIPTPKFAEINETKTLNIKSIVINETDINRDVIDDFYAFLSKINIQNGNGSQIGFLDDDSLDNEEYRLEISDKIRVYSNSLGGKIFALQTLKQILFQYGENVPCLTIKDKPAHEIRGFMLDVGRYFYSVDDVKLFIRKMSLHKLNFLHLHLTEDQGWRVEIEKYPLLTQIGSVRKKTNFNHKKHGGFYTKAQIKEIVDYAHNFAISVMPEFDIPGHSRSAMAGYNYLGCFDRKLPVADHWGVKHDVLCAGKDSTYEFVENIIDEFCEMFPDKYFHIGGDEVPKHRWHLCPHCQAKMKELGLKNEDELQYYFMNRVNDYCKSNGKQVFMWSWDLKDDKLLSDDLGFTKCGDMNTGNRPFIDTSTSAYYIDLPYGYISLKDTADHRLYSGNCLGGEVTLWTEYVPNMTRADKVTYPRLGAMAQTVWHGDNSYEQFAENLDYYYSFLDKNGIGYSKPSTANPSKLLAFFQNLWFERRQLTWEGLTNIFDDLKIERLAKKQHHKTDC